MIRIKLATHFKDKKTPDDGQAEFEPDLEITMNVGDVTLLKQVNDETILSQEPSKQDLIPDLDDEDDLQTDRKILLEREELLEMTEMIHETSKEVHEELNAKQIARRRAAFKKGDIPQYMNIVTILMDAEEQVLTEVKKQVLIKMNIMPE